DGLAKLLHDLGILGSQAIIELIGQITEEANLLGGEKHREVNFALFAFGCFYHGVIMPHPKRVGKIFLQEYFALYE
ncbi:MAG: hypothetical protein EBR82_47340, partial [Caulobacteraceae bacterium]|nr:hypothetical protein [Caulobacteraceae bacterium]